jgi:hypothetical protein
VIILLVGLAMVVFGFQNFLHDMGSFRAPSLIPLATYTASVPIAGALIVLFSIEQIVNGWRHGFEGRRTRTISRGSKMSNGAILLLMTALFLGFRLYGRAGRVRADGRRAGRMQPHADQHAIDGRPDVPRHRFRDPAGGSVLPPGGGIDDVGERDQPHDRVAQTMVGHLRGGLAQVVTLFSMFFAGVSGSSTADVAS